MRVVVAAGVTDDLRAFTMATPRTQVQVVHRDENASLFVKNRHIFKVISWRFGFFCHIPYLYSKASSVVCL